MFRLFVLAFFVSSFFSFEAFGESPNSPKFIAHATPNNKDTDVDELNDQVAHHLFAVGYIIVKEGDCAKKLSQALLNEGLAASVNILPDVQSIVPAEPAAEGTGAMIVFITRVVNIPLVKVLVEAEMVEGETEAPFYQIFFTVLADINGEYLQFIDRNSIDASQLLTNSTTSTTTTTEPMVTPVTAVPTETSTPVEPAIPVTAHSHTKHSTHAPKTTALRRTTTKAPYHNIVDLTSFDGTEFEVRAKRHQPLTLQLQTSAGSGHTWQIDLDNTTYKNIEGPIDIPNQDEMPGAPHLVWFILTPDVSGVIALDHVGPTGDIARSLVVSILTT